MFHVEHDYPIAQLKKNIAYRNTALSRTLQMGSPGGLENFGADTRLPTIKTSLIN
jgi:hypothetical protein